jgi:RNAse (barnase) inhibitor barstar
MKKQKKQKPDEIKIDYDNIDVADIMEQIRIKIESQPEEPEPPHAEGTGDPHSPDSAPPEMGSPQGSKEKAKTLLQKIMKPFAPFIKFLVFPVHQELRNTIEILDRTNKNLETLWRKHDQVDPKIDATNRRIDLAFKDLNRAKEYIRLLHNLSHNLVVELTKLKIESENLKIKTRIMEKDFEFLGQKEKVLERKVFE